MRKKIKAADYPSRRMRILLDISPAGIVFVDAAGAVTYANRRAEELLGLSRKDMAGRIYNAPAWQVARTDGTPLPDEEFPFSIVKRRKRAVTGIEHSMVSPDGRRFMLSVSGSPLLSDDGEFLGMVAAIEDITERRRAQDALSKSEKRFRQLFNAMAEGFAVHEIICDREGRPVDYRFLDVNPAFERLTGLKREAIVGRTVLEVMPAIEKVWIENYGRVALTGESMSFESTAIALGKRYAVNAFSPQKGQFAVSFLDITGLRAAEEKAKRELGISDAVMDSIPGAFYMLDEKGRYARWNAYQRDTIAARSDETMPDTFAIETIHPDDRPLILSKIENVLKNGVEERVEGRVLLRGGPDFRWLLMTGRRIFIDGRPFLVGIGVDITERKNAESALEESRSLVSSVVENIPLMIFLKEAKDLRFVIFNKAGEELLGYDRKLLLGKNNLDLFPPEQAENFMVKDRAVLDGEAGFLDIPEEPISTANKGERILHTRKVRISGSDGTTRYLLGISEDITERKRAEAEREAMHSRLLQSGKMESVGCLAGGIAHDFNNLLTAIGGYAEFLLKSLPEGDPRREDVGDIISAADRATMLTRQLLAFSRKQILNPQVIDVNASVGNMFKMLKRLIGEDVRLETRLAHQACYVKADPGQIDQVLVNLAVNARDAMPNGGKLLLETAVIRPEKEFFSKHPDLAAGTLVRVSVRDSGVGLSDEARAHLFEPFFTTKERGKGTGLGLSTVFGIVKQSGGDIEAESGAGAGTAFHLYFPQAPAPAGGTEKPSGSGSGPRGTETILLVEDEDSLRRLGERLLRMNGYTVISAADGKSALEAAERHGRPVDLLLTDVVMPGMSGRQLSSELLRRNLVVRTLFMSGYTDDAIVQHGVLDQGVAFIYKPFSSDALSAKVREVLDGPVDKAKA